MKRGPKPQATHLKLLRGNPSRVPLTFDEPRPDAMVEIPITPVSLVGAGAEQWRVVCEQLKRLGMLVKVDLPALEAYCQAFEQFRTAALKIAEIGRADPASVGGLLVTGAMGTKIVNPLVAVGRRAALDMVRFANEFGFTPVARVRIQAPADGGKPSKFGELLAD
jgi:P27 family predicted phage terminase small subunit